MAPQDTTCGLEFIPPVRSGRSTESNNFGATVTNEYNNTTDNKTMSTATNLGSRDFADHGESSTATAHLREAGEPKNR